MFNVKKLLARLGFSYVGPSLGSSLSLDQVMENRRLEKEKKKEKKIKIE